MRPPITECTSPLAARAAVASTSTNPTAVIGASGVR